METKEWHFRDKSKWKPGPWKNEPDKIQWEDKATGLPCLIVRDNSGALCGYVGVAETHPWFGKDYQDVDADVHGGLTYSDYCAESEKETGICHIAEDGLKRYWFGFDCAHSFDFCPAYQKDYAMWCDLNATYKSVNYVRVECTSLAKQLQAGATKE